MSMPGLVMFNLEGLNESAAEQGAPSRENIIEGSPTTLTWVLNESADGKTVAGVWQATPGAWRVRYDEWEYCAILSGESVLERNGHPPQPLRAGVHLVLEPGFEGIWRVISVTRKTFVVRLP